MYDYRIIRARHTALLFLSKEILCVVLTLLERAYTRAIIPKHFLCIHKFSLLILSINKFIHLVCSFLWCLSHI